MRSKYKSPHEREAIVAEYLMGNGSFCYLSYKHEVDFRAIYSWMMKFKGKKKVKIAPSAGKLVAPYTPSFVRM